MKTEDFGVYQLIDHPENEGVYGPVTADDDLVESIRERGILQPLIISDEIDGTSILERPDGSTTGFYRVIAGHRRLHAARAAGLEMVPCEMRHYESREEEVIDLIHSNRHRTKTTKQVNDEVVRLREALSETAKANSAANLKRGDSSSGPIEPVGETNSKIAEKTGLSASDIKRRTIACDPAYRESFFEELRELGANEEMVEECRKQWVNIHRELDLDKLKVSAAANKAKTLMQEFRELCPKFKKPKGKPAKKGATKNGADGGLKFAVMTIADEDEDAFREYGEIGDARFGMFNLGDVTAPAVRKGDHVAILDWKDFVKSGMPHLKKPAVAKTAAAS